MSSEMNHPELAAIESALLSLAPAPASVDRDRLMFFAGRARVGADGGCGAARARRRPSALVAVVLVGWLPVDVG